MALLHQPQDLGELGHGADQLPGAIAAPVEVGDFCGGFAEQEEVFSPHLLADLHVGAVQGADREGPIHGKFHIARAGGLLAGGGDLLGEIGGRVDPLAQLDVVVGQEDHPQAPVHVGVGIDRFGDAVDETNNQFGHVVARGRLAAEDHRARGHPLGLAVLDTQVLGYHLQGIEVLALVLVDALDLHIKERGRIHQHAGVAVDVVAQLALHRQLGGLPALQEAGVVDELLQLAQLVEPVDPALSDRLVQQG